MSYDDLDALKAQGIDAIMNLCAEFCDLHEIEKASGFEVYYLPVCDEETPELQELEKALAWLDESIYLGKKVLIHCRHGIGRTGTVLNAYLLRRGLGHKLAGKALKKLCSKPSNFLQWRTVRRYGKQAGRLTVRQPSLEFPQAVDLSPFLHDYQELSREAGEAVQKNAEGRCGAEHDRCCHTPVALTLIEAVHISTRINTGLSSEERMLLIERAVAAAGKEREISMAPGWDHGAYCLLESGAICPLLVNGHCLLFAFRPLQCRTYDMEEGVKTALWRDRLHPVLNRLSLEIFLALSAEFVTGDPPLFPLPDVVSGRYVQAFFHHLLKGSSAGQ
jgi:hypothetical protein